MNRYGVFSVSGWLTPQDGGTRPMPRTWYVYDAAYCGEIIFESEGENVARQEAFRLNAEDRIWEKHQEMAHG